MHNAIRMNVGFVACLILGLGIPSLAATPNKPAQADDAWEHVLHRGLVLYWKGQHKDVFTLTEEVCRRSKPGPGVHQALALMTKAFRECNDVHQENRDWSASAKAYLRKLANKDTPTDIDLMLLALLGSSSNRATDVSVLDKLIAAYPKSPWYDWAFWERTRVLGSEAYVGEGPLGVVVVRSDRPLVSCVIMNDPQLWVQGRAAEAFLQSRPGTYMSDTMREDLARWRITLAMRSLQALEASGSGYMLTEQQSESIAKAKGAIRSVEAHFPEAMKRRAKANRMLKEFLWGSGEKWKIIDYFQVLTKRPEGEGSVLQKDITAWVTPLLEQRRKQKAKWHRVDIQRSAARSSDTTTSRPARDEAVTTEATEP